MGTQRQFECAICKQTFTAINSIEDRDAEYGALYANDGWVPDEERASVCDNCHPAMLDYVLKRLGAV